MRRIQCEAIDLGALFAQCRNQKRKVDVRQRLDVAGPSVLLAAQRYEELGLLASLHMFESPPLAVNAANNDDFVDLYELGLVRKGGAGRWAYDLIFASAPLGVCPFCAQRPVGTLDHYLPKVPFGILAITPLNLVPACRDCNWAKDDAFVPQANLQPFHPYFEAPPNIPWLAARLRRGQRIAAEFYIAADDRLSQDQAERIAYHFQVFSLQRLYSTQAAVELINMKHRLRGLLAAGGPEAVRGHLAEEADSRRQSHVSSWQAALYTCLSQDIAFYEGDFELA